MLGIFEVTEVCPHCDRENTLVWDYKNDGYEIHCPHCGEKILLCDACFHSDDNEGMKCDWHEGKCFRNKK